MTISHQAQRILAEAPRLNVGGKVNAYVRDMLQDLASDCGMAYTTSCRANDADLISIWRVALRDPEAARRTADKVTTRLNGQTVTARPFPAPPAPDPVPAPLPSPAPFDPAKVQALIDASLASIMRDTATMAREAAAEALKALTPTLLNVSVNAAPVVALGMVHEQTPRIIRALARGDHVYLYGPAGSGKTTMGQKAAEAFGLQFYMVAQVEDQYALLGFTIPNPTSPTGYDVVRTQFREAFEHGGLLLWDELDRSGAGAVTAINAALANGFCAFPDGLVYMHPDFKLIAAGNTTMRGASNLYAAAQQQDASVLDRFAFIPFGYDAHIEDSHPQATDKDWVAYVRAVRQAASESGLDVVVSPRATYRGCVALASGETWDDVAETYLFKGIDPAWEAQLRKAARHAWKG